MAVTTKKNPNNQCLYDGFKEIFRFPVHKLDIKGFCFIGEDVRHSDGIRKEAYLSWDIKQMVLWEKLSIEDTPRAIQTIKYEVSNLICCAVYIPKLKIFVCAALDMTFRIYDKRFNFLETINHEERAVLHMEYDNNKDILILGGASGVSVWRIYRNTNIDLNHVMEKMYFFEGFSGWVKKMIYEPYSNRVYAIVDETIHILSFKRRAVVARLEKIHDAPVTCVVWYARSQFYVTGCSLGQLKCWSSHFSKSNRKQKESFDSKALEKYEDEDGIPRNQIPGINNFALLHTFNAHSKSITGLVLHPISGLAITTSLDGFLKVFNLENLTELFSIDNGYSIDAMRIIPYGTSLDMTGKPQVGRACLFSQPDGTIRLWQVTSLCGFFGVCNSKIKSVYVFENLHLAVEKKMRALDALEGAVSEEEAAYRSTRGCTPCLEPRVVVGHGSHDLRAFKHKGFVPTCFMDPDSVVNGIIDFTISVYFQLMYVLLEIGVIRVYCMKKLNTELVRDIELRTELEIRDGTCVVLLDVLPSDNTRPVGSKQTAGKDMRGLPSPAYIQEQLLIGTKNGTLFFLDTLKNNEISWVGQVHFGPILDMKYRKPRNELVIFCKDSFVDNYSVKVFNISNMIMTHELKDMYNITCFNCSPSLDMFGLGCDDGYIRLYQLSNNDSSCFEVLSQSVTHDASVVSITFNDNLRIYCSCSSDSTVMVWDYEKQLIRQLKYHIPTNKVSFIPNDSFPEGTILLTQGYYILTITRGTWDEGDRLDNLKTSSEWTADWTQEMIDNLDNLNSSPTAATKAGNDIICAPESRKTVGGGGAIDRIAATRSIHFAGVSMINSILAEGPKQLSAMDLFRDKIDYWGIKESKYDESDYALELKLSGSGGLGSFNSTTYDYISGKSQQWRGGEGSLRPSVTHRSRPRVVPSVDLANLANKVVQCAIGCDPLVSDQNKLKEVITNAKYKSLNIEFLKVEAAATKLSPSAASNSDTNINTSAAILGQSAGKSNASVDSDTNLDPTTSISATADPIHKAPSGKKLTVAPVDRYRSFLSPRARLTLLNSTELSSRNNSHSLKDEDRAQIEAVIESMKDADYFDPNYENTTYENMLKSKIERSIEAEEKILSADAFRSINDNIQQVVVFNAVFNEYMASKKAYNESRSTRNRLLKEHSWIAKTPSENAKGSTKGKVEKRVEDRKGSVMRAEPLFKDQMHGHKHHLTGHPDSEIKESNDTHETREKSGYNTTTTSNPTTNGASNTNIRASFLGDSGKPRRTTFMRDDGEELALKKIDLIINKRNKLLDEGMSEEGQAMLRSLHGNANIRKRDV